MRLGFLAISETCFREFPIFPTLTERRMRTAAPILGFADGLANYTGKLWTEPASPDGLGQKLAQFILSYYGRELPEFPILPIGEPEESPVSSLHLEINHAGVKPHPTVFLVHAFV